MYTGAVITTADILYRSIDAMNTVAGIGIFGHFAGSSFCIILSWIQRQSKGYEATSLDHIVVVKLTTQLQYRRIESFIMDPHIELLHHEDKDSLPDLKPFYWVFFFSNLKPLHRIMHCAKFD